VSQNRELQRRFQQLTTANVADGCLRAGVEVRCAPAAVVAVDRGMRLAGRVLPAQHSGSVDVFLEAFENAQPGDVLVVDNAGRSDESCVGDLITLEAQEAGLAGILIWGLHRDTADLLAIGLPVFSLGSLPTGPLPTGQQPAGQLLTRPQHSTERRAGALKSAHMGEWTVDITDIVVADEDGALFVAAERADEVFTHAEQIRATEARQAELIRGGDSLRAQVRFGEYLEKKRTNPALTLREHLRTVGGAVEV
jgi:4-hydroxy-4-methyl-2-oxoglutarate aldolase